MAAKITVKQRTGTTNFYRDGKFVGEFPEIGFGFTIEGQMSGLAGTEAAAWASAKKFRDGTPVPVALERESRHIMDTWHDDALAVYPFTAQEKLSLMGKGFSQAWVDGKLTLLKQ